jgi:outer membrane protein TolC
MMAPRIEGGSAMKRHMYMLLFAFLLAAPALAGAPPGNGEKPRGWTLEEVLAAARAQDPRVAMEEAGVAFARARLEEVEWSWFPAFETTLVGGGPVPEARQVGSSFDDITPASRLGDLDFGQMGYLIRADAKGALPIYTFGKLTAAQEAATRGVEVARASADRARDGAARDAARAFFGWQIATEGLRGLDEAESALATLRTAVEKLVQQGSAQVERSDLLKLDYLALELKAQRAVAQRGRDVALEGVRLLTGRRDIALAEGALTVPSPLPAMDDLKRRARDVRPEVRMVRSGVAAHTQLLELQKAMRWPDIALVGFVTLAYSNATTKQTNPFAYDPYNQRDAGVGLLLRHTWDFPQKAARAQQALAELSRVEAQGTLLDRGIDLEVNDAYTAFDEARARAAALLDQEAAARRWLTAASAAFDTGLGPLRDVLESALLYGRARVERLRAAHDANVSRAEVARAVGVPLHELGNSGAATATVTEAKR